MVIGGSSTVFWDLFASPKIGKIKAKREQKKSNPQRMAEESDAPPSIPLERVASPTGVQRRGVPSKDADSSGDTAGSPVSACGSESRDGGNDHAPTVDTDSHSLPVKWGLLIIAGFFGTPFPNIFIWATHINTLFN